MFKCILFSRSVYNTACQCMLICDDHHRNIHCQFIPMVMSAILPMAISVIDPIKAYAYLCLSFFWQGCLWAKILELLWILFPHSPIFLRLSFDCNTQIQLNFAGIKLNFAIKLYSFCFGPSNTVNPLRLHRSISNDGEYTLVLGSYLP